MSSLSQKPGYRLTELGHKVEEGKCKAFYIFGEDPAQTEADLAQFRRTLGGMDLVIVQDIFMTQTAEMADVILPPPVGASTRGSTARRIAASSASTRR